MNWRLIIPWFLFLLALFLRGIGAFHGLEYGLLIHPDEMPIISFANHLAQGIWKIPDWSYCPLWTYIMALSIKLDAVLRSFWDAWLGWGFGKQIFDSMRAAMIARILGIWFGSLGIFFVWRIGIKHFNQRIAFWAALLLALSPGHILFSHYGYLDIPQTTVLLLALDQIFHIHRTGLLKHYIFCGIWIGFSMAIKINSAPFVLVLWAVHILKYKNTQKSKLMWGSVVAFLAYAVWMPYFFLNPKFMMWRFQQIYEVIFGDLWISNKSTWRAFLDQANNLIQMTGWSHMALVVIAIVVAYWTWNRRKLALILFFPMVYFMTIVFANWQDEREVIIIIPFIILFAVSAVHHWKTRWISLGLSVFALMGVQDIIEVDQLFWLKDTQQLANDWITEHIPIGSKIAKDNYTADFEKGLFKQPKHDIRYLPMDQVSNKIRYYLASSICYERYLKNPDGNAKLTEFYRNLFGNSTKIKSFEYPNAPLNFVSPDISLYQVESQKKNTTKHGWDILRPAASESSNSMVMLDNSLFEKSAFNWYVKGRDKKTFYVSPVTKPECAILFMRNGARDAKLTVHVGWKSYDLRVPAFQNVAEQIPLPEDKNSLFKITIDYRGDAGCEFVWSWSYLDALRKIVWQNDFSYLFLSEYQLDWNKVSFMEALLYGSALCTQENFEQAYKIWNKTKEVFPELWNEYWSWSFQNDLDWNSKFKKLTSIDISEWEKFLRYEVPSRDFASLIGAHRTEQGWVFKGQVEHGFMVYGPYKKLNPGFYNIEFDTSLISLENGSKVNWNVYDGQTMLSEYEKSFDSSTVFSDKVRLPFEVKSSARNLEFRVYIKGQLEITLRSVTIFPDIQKNLILEKAKITKGMAQAAYSNSDFTQCLEWLKQLTDYPGLDSIDLKLKVLCLIELDKTDQAIKLLQKIVQDYPHHIEFWQIWQRLEPDNTNVKKSIQALMPQTEFLARFEDKIELLGYDFKQNGREINITYYWKCLKPVPNSWVVFVHINHNGDKVLQQDHYPCSGTYPTFNWRQGEVVKESYTIIIPEELGKGSYEAVVGWWEPAGQSLKVSFPKGKNMDRVTLYRFEIQ